METNLAPVPHLQSTRVTRPPDRYSPSKYQLIREEEEMLCMLYIECVMQYRRTHSDGVNHYIVLCTQ